MSKDKGTNIVIREAELTDAVSINSLSSNELGYSFDINKTIATLRLLLLNKENCILVACIENEVVGYIHANFYVSLYGDKMSNIMGIAVNNKHQRKGIGNSLLSSIESWSKENNLSGVRLLSGETRLNAHQFYQHCGYEFDKKQIKLFKRF